MGYFANGTAGEDFQCRFCFQCANWRLDEQNPDRGEGCPVWDAHLIAGSQHPEHAKNERDRGAAETTRMLLGVLIGVERRLAVRHLHHQVVGIDVQAVLALALRGDQHELAAAVGVVGLAAEGALDQLALGAGLDLESLNLMLEALGDFVDGTPVLREILSATASCIASSTGTRGSLKPTQAPATRFGRIRMNQPSVLFCVVPVLPATR